MKVLAICGSLPAQSYNLALLNARALAERSRCTLTDPVTRENVAGLMHPFEAWIVRLGAYVV